MQEIVRGHFTASCINSFHQSSVSLIKSGKRLRDVNKSKVEELKNSIRSCGILQPILIRPKDSKGFYQLVAGEHRLQAIKELWEEGSEHDLPARIIYVADDNTKIVEISENLYRNDLNKAQRDRFTAMLLEMMKPPKDENRQSSKTANGGFKPPVKKVVASQLNLPIRTLERDFKAYQTECGVTNNWVKLTEEEYDGFIRWFEDRAKEAEEKERLDKDNDDEKKKAAEEKARQKAIKTCASALTALHNKHGDRGVLDALQEAGLSYLIGED